ncbi:hypothetical protein [Woodsholea maritima]|uniref:hypothetical protein n=1 Tax=Woodsholea maritima TaxID=240237 RepID=UPI00037D523D|nr:hypothetical protein [Woodsholea maritima]
MPNITFQGAQLAGSNACGAYATTAALHALNNAMNPVNYEMFTPTPHFGSDTYGLLTPGAVVVNPVHAGAVSPFADMLYGITGILPSPLPVTPVNSTPATQYQPANGPGVVINANQKLSTPYSICSAIQQTAPGTTVTVNVTTQCQRFLTDYFNANGVPGLFDSEAGLIRTLANTSLNLQENSYYLPSSYIGTNTVQIVLVGQGGMPSHWLARGSNDLWYDPASGNPGNAWAFAGPNVDTPLNPFPAANIGVYTWMGLWIEVA